MKTRQHFVPKIVLLFILMLAALAIFSCGDDTCEHEWGEWTAATAPTCESAGFKTRVCSLCEEPETETVPMLGHRFDSYASNHNATCQSNATETATCANGCGKIDTRELADTKDPSKHASTEVTYRKNGTDGEKHDKIYACCNAIIETVAHNWDNGTPDPENAGVTVYTCADCKTTKKVGDVTAGHTHSAVKISASAETCTAFGNIEYWPDKLR